MARFTERAVKMGESKEKATRLREKKSSKEVAKKAHSHISGIKKLAPYPSALLKKMK